MNIAEAMERIAAIQADLSVDVDGIGTMKVAQAFPSVPSGAEGALSLPCFLNYWTFESVKYPSYRVAFYIIHSQLLMAEAGSDLEQWGRVAFAFHQAYLDALTSHVMLGDRNTFNHIRSGNDSGSGTFQILEWNSVPHYGLDYMADLQLYDNFGTGP